MAAVAPTKRSGATGPTILAMHRSSKTLFITVISLISIVSCVFVFFEALHILTSPARPVGGSSSAARGRGGRKAGRGGGSGGVVGSEFHSYSRPSTKSAGRPTTARPEAFKVVILTMDRLSSLKRLVESLSRPDCSYESFGMDVDLIFHVDRPKAGKDTAAWIETVRWTVENVTWPHGSTFTLVANENMGLRRAWLEAWHPESDDDRAIILEDDVTVSPLWYRWVNGAYDAYGQDVRRIAGFSLQRQDLVPLTSKTRSSVPTNDNEPFLYSLVGSIGFAPNARVWRNFLDWAECAIENDVDVSVDGLVTSDWWKKLDKRGMWTQHFIYYMNRLGLACLYHFPKDAGKALGVHWREKGEHYDRNGGASHGVVTDPGEISDLVFPEVLNVYDFGAAPNKSGRARPTTLVVAAAVGYSADVFASFVGTLRQHYDGDALLLVRKDPPPDVLKILEENRVFYREYFGDNTCGNLSKNPCHGEGNWDRFNIERFEFYRIVCEEYDYCMALDFRDSVFQGDPFGYLRAEPELSKAELVTQSHAHIWDFTRTAAGEVKYHNRMIPYCNIPEGLDVRNCMTGKPLINAGGIVGRPSAFEKLEKVVNLIANPDRNPGCHYLPCTCSDQMAMNIGVHCGLEGLGEGSAVPLQGTGHGPINTVGWGSVFTTVGESFGDLDCMPSPVVHQGDLIEGVDLPHRKPAKEPLFSPGWAVLVQAG